MFSYYIWHPYNNNVNNNIIIKATPTTISPYFAFIELIISPKIFLIYDNNTFLLQLFLD